MTAPARAAVAPSVEPSTQGRPEDRSTSAARDRARRLALLPLAGLLGALTIVPTVYVLVVSLTDRASTNQDPSFVGADNYVAMFTDPDYWGVLARTLAFVIAAVTLQLGLALAVAVAMSSLRRGDALLRAVILLPLAAAPIAMLFNWRQILNAQYGPLNHLLGLVGLGPVDWLGSTALALPTLVVVDTWQWTPFVFVILAGGLASVPSDVYEAAAVDGASEWQRFCHITVPLLRPFILVAVLFRTIDALKTFDAVQVLTAGGPGSSTTMLNYSIFQQGINFLDFGRASASAVVFLVVCVLLTKLLLNGLAKEDT